MMLNTVKILQSRVNLIKVCRPKRLPALVSHRTINSGQNFLKNDAKTICLSNPLNTLNKFYYSTNENSPASENDFSEIKFEKYCSETLENLSDYFDELVERFNKLSEADVTNQDGVLTVSLGQALGSYVINKQTPNKQIWLSSPRSGPKRFDFIFTSDKSAATDHHNLGYWYYKHEGHTLHELLDKEFSDIIGTQTDFQKLAFGLKC